MKYGLIACGGTFDIIHKGHEALLEKAFEVGEKVIIGISSDNLVKILGKKHPVKPLDKRFKNLKKYLEKKGWLKRSIIVVLEDRYGPPIHIDDVEALIVSEETYKVGLKTNRIRRRKKMKPLKIIKIPLVLAEDGKPISCTRIKMGEIDRNGRLIKK